MSYQWRWTVLLEPAGSGQSYLGWLLSGLQITVVLSLAAWLCALAVGTLAGVLRSSGPRPLRWLLAGYVEVFRNIPLLVQLFIWYFVMPEVLPFGEQIKDLSPPMQQFVAAWLTLSLYTSVRICEQVRAGLGALRAGQAHAAAALGMRAAQRYRYVLLPQCLRILMPPLTSEFMAVFKNSAVASTIGLLDLASQGRQLVDYTSQPYEAFIAVTLLYLAVNGLVLLFMRSVGARLDLGGPP